MGNLRLIFFLVLGISVLILLGCESQNMVVKDKVVENTLSNNETQKVIKISHCENKEKEAKITCYTDEAFQKNDSSLCDLFEGRDSCYSALASQKLDLIICEKIIDNQIKQGCYLEMALTTQNVSICAKLIDNVSQSPSMQSSCYWFFAGTTNNNNNYCAKILATDAREACLRGEWLNG